MTDSEWMALARRKLTGSTVIAHVPRVAAIIVDAAEQIVGSGVKFAPAGVHAEQRALKQAAGRGTTLYTTLEPCRNMCSVEILSAGISRVVYGSTDPTPSTGGGAAWLTSQGVQVTQADAAECDSLNGHFLVPGDIFQDLRVARRHAQNRRHDCDRGEKARVLAALAGAPGRRLLDLCCGSGELSYVLAADAHASVDAFDSSQHLLDWATANKAHANVTYAHADVLTHAFGSNVYDGCVFAMSAMYFTDAQLSVIFSKAYASLKNNAWLVMTYPHNQNVLEGLYASRWPIEGTLKRMRRPTTYETMLTSAGFSSLSSVEIPDTFTVLTKARR